MLAAVESREGALHERGTLRAAEGRSLLLVVPAWQRVELAAICYAQQALLRDEVRIRHGLHLDVLVIADDENLDAAEEAGLLTLEHMNWLGAKLNAGYSYAAQHGYEYVCALGSDSWMHADRLAWLPDEDTLLCTRNYVCLSPDGERQGWFRVGYDAGVGSRITPIGLLEPVGFAPLRRSRMKSCDRFTLETIRGYSDPLILYTDLHPFEIVGFQSETQVTSYEALIDRWLAEWHQPFSGLRDYYPAELVDRIENYYRKAQHG